MIYITSDLHLGHSNILKYQLNRDYGSIEEMNAGIVEEWNSVATDKDTIYILGDVAFLNDNAETANLMSNLNGTIKVVPGNHDYDLNQVRYRFIVQGLDKLHNKAPFEILPPIFELKYRKHKIVMCHYPLSVWHGSNRNIRSDEGKKSSIHLNGHQHGKGDNTVPYRLDVGWDCFNRLVSLDEIIDKFYPTS